MFKWLRQLFRFWFKEPPVLGVNFTIEENQPTQVGFRYMLCIQRRVSSTSTVFDMLSYQPAWPDDERFTPCRLISTNPNFVWVAKTSLRCEFISELEAKQFVATYLSDINKKVMIVPFIPNHDELTERNDNGEKSGEKDLCERPTLTGASTEENYARYGPFGGHNFNRRNGDS